MAGVAAVRGDGVDESLVDAADHVAVPSGGGQHRIGEVETEFVDMVTAAHGLDSSHWMFKLRGRVRHPLQKTTTLLLWVALVSPRLGGAPLGG